MSFDWTWMIVAVGAACLWLYFDVKQAAKKRLQANATDAVDGDDTE